MTIDKETQKSLGCLEITPCLTRFTIKHSGNYKSLYVRPETKGIIACITELDALTCWLNVIVTRVGKKGKERLEKTEFIIQNYLELGILTGLNREHQTIIETELINSKESLLAMSELDFLAWAKSEEYFITYLIRTYKKPSHIPFNKISRELSMLSAGLAQLRNSYFIPGAKLEKRYTLELKEELIALIRFIESATSNCRLYYEKCLWSYKLNSLRSLGKYISTKKDSELTNKNSKLKDIVNKELAVYKANYTIIQNTLTARGF